MAAHAAADVDDQRICMQVELLGARGARGGHDDASFIEKLVLYMVVEIPMINGLATRFR